MRLPSLYKRGPVFGLSAICAAIFCCATAGTAEATAIDLSGPTTGWTVVSYANNNPDPSNDQQTGTPEGDIVGNSLHPSVYTTFDNAGTPSLTDGYFAFRIRVGADTNPSGFKTAVFVGIDANNDGKLDLFIGINNSGSSDTVGIWNPGTGANISPNTTSIVSTPLVSYTPTASNYFWAPVTTVNDPTVGSATDIDGGGQNDYFLTFSVPFSDVVTQLAALGVAGVNENTVLSYVVATATQANSLNQDLNGVGKTYDPSATWQSLGVLSNPMSANGIAAVPEVSPALGVAAFLGLIFASGFRRRNVSAA